MTICFDSGNSRQSLARAAQVANMIVRTPPKPTPTYPGMASAKGGKLAAPERRVDGDDDARQTTIVLDCTLGEGRDRQSHLRNLGVVPPAL